MSYIIYKSDGTTLCSISDGTINVTSTSLGLPGRLYPGYGQVFDTNFVHVTENFANSSPPANPLRGQFWYDTGNAVMRVSPIDNEATTSNWMVLSTFDSNGNLGHSGSFSANNLNLTNNVYANNTFLSGYANITQGISANGAYTGLFSDGIVVDYVVANGRISVGTSDGINFYNNGIGVNKIFGIDANGNITSGNATLGNSATATYFTGTLTTHAQPNITSVGTLSSLTVGNVSSNTLFGNGTINANGNITANYLLGNGSALSSITGANVTGYVPNANVANTVSVGAQPNITSATNLASIGTITTGVWQGSPIQPSYVATLNQNTTGYAATVSVSSQPNITQVSNSFTQLTFASNGSITMSGISSQIAGANLLSGTYLNGTLTTPAQPNITSLGTLQSLSVSGAISGATVNGNGSGLNSLSGPNVIGTVANANYALYAQQLVGGAGASTAVTVTANAQPNITSVGTLTGLVVSGNITGANLNGNHFGNGAGLTNINGANVTGTVPYAAVANSVAGANVSGPVANATYASQAGSLTAGVNATTANTVTNASQPNITTATNLVTVGTLNSLAVNGTIYTAGSFSGNGSGISYILAASVSGTVANAAYATSAGSVSGANVIGAVPSATIATSATTAGTVTTNAQPNITSVGTLTSLSVNGNITGANINGNFFGNLSGNGAAISSINGANVTGTVANAAYATSAGLAASATTAGTVTTAAQPNITSVGTLTLLSVNGNITGANLNGNHYGNGSGLTSITGANVTGTVSYAAVANSVAGANVTGTVSSASVASTVSTGAQPNITSVGTLTNLSVNGNISAGNLFATLVYGTVAIAAQPNITSLGTLSGLVSSNTVDTTTPNSGGTTGGLRLRANATSGNAYFQITDSTATTQWGYWLSNSSATANLIWSGNLSTAGTFYGNGAGLANITGANVTGTVSSATNAVYAGTAGVVNTITGPQVTTALGFTPYNATNPNNFVSLSAWTENFNAQGNSGLFYGGTKGGWTKLPNGLIMQWGNDETYHSGEGGVTVTYPIAFPNMVLSVVAVDRGNADAGNDMWVQVPYIGNTYCTIFYQASSGGNNGYGYRWVAFGY